jgi:hypothetical protein
MEFEMKHVMYAVVIALVYLVVGWILSLFGLTGMYIFMVLVTTLVYGGAVYALREVKNCMEGLMTGLVYVVVWAVLAIIFGLINFGGAPLFERLSFGSMFGFPGIWIPAATFLLFAMALGYINKQK